MTTFDDLGLNENLMKAISDAGYTQPTPIQAQAIPAILMAKDVIGLAQTGTGKTAGFTLPMMEILSDGRARARMPRSLILSPTRELAAQIAENFDKYGQYSPLSKALIVGGTSMNEQMKLLDQGVDVLIATPGRLIDLFERGHILLNDIKILVIDEADRMLDMGFIPDIESIASRLPAFRQTLLFSATMPDAIKKLTEQFMMNPKTVAVSAPSSTAKTVDQNLIWTDVKSKKNKVLSLIKNNDVKNAFIFCNRKRDVSMLADWLKKQGLNAAALHGDMAQAKRMEVLAEFKDGTLDLMVCSDVAARGLDIKQVSHVFNYDIPFNAEDYVHRIGRTGRAGEDGSAFSLAVTGDDEKLVQAIEKTIGKPIPTHDIAQGKQQAKTTKKANKQPAKTHHASNGQNKPEETQPSKQQNKPKKHHNNDDQGPDVEGFGDDIPAFMRIK